MVDIARQRAKWFFLLKVFVGVLLSCFQSVFQRELELLNSVLKYPLSNYKVMPINFETQISLRRQAPSNISPSKEAFEKYKPRGLFSEFCGI